MRGDSIRNGSGKRRIVVLYDGFCPVCRRSARIIRTLDILHAIDLRRYQDFPIEELPVSLEKMNKRVQACSIELNNCREGIFAFASILIRIPPLFIPAVVSFLLGATGLGQKLYDYISDNRYNLPFSGITDIFIKSGEERK